MIAIVRNRRAGIYCAHRLGDEPSRSSTGCRYYVYVGRACEAWLDYHDLSTALDENPGEPVFDRTIADEGCWGADPESDAADNPR
jgi:hypothetical protein